MIFIWTSFYYEPVFIAKWWFCNPTIIISRCLPLSGRVWVIPPSLLLFFSPFLLSFFSSLHSFLIDLWICYQSCLMNFHFLQGFIIYYFNVPYLFQCSYYFIFTYFNVTRAFKATYSCHTLMCIYFALCSTLFLTLCKDCTNSMFPLFKNLNCLLHLIELYFLWAWLLIFLTASFTAHEPKGLIIQPSPS